MRIDRRVFQHFDWNLLALTLIIACMGIVNLYSASKASMPGLYRTQVLWVLIGVFLAVSISAIDYRLLDRFAIFIYLAGIAALVGVLVKGYMVSGSQRWLLFGGLRAQPSEFMKLGVIIMLAKYFHRDTKREGYDLRELLIPILIIAIPVALVLPQPDLGSAALIGIVAFSMLIFLGIKIKTLVSLGIGGVALCLAGWFLVLAEYQKRRIISFLNPEDFTRDAGYHAIQSMIAIGSGGLWGKGFLGGTQSRLSFLPEQHTDFVFSVLAEEWGFIGASVVIAAYLILLLLIINTATKSSDKLGTLLAIGIASMIFWHTFINMGMVIGILPVVGVPLPLMSYGGSTTITTFIGIGVLLSISMRRFIF